MISIGIKYKQNTNGHLLYGYSNVNLASDKDTTHLTFIYYFLLAGPIVFWGNKRQTSMALSNTKFEYIVLSKAIVEVIWL
jgi:hypothetical protein